MKILAILALAALPLGRAVFAEEFSADESWKRLLEGNARFASGKATHPHQDFTRRAETVSSQSPFAIVVGCADSRTSPELLFDQGLGDLFVVRMAGNIIDDAALGSIEFAVSKLGTRLIVVLGHENCGAVGAAVAAQNRPETASGKIHKIVKAIRPAVERVQGKTGDEVDNAMAANVSNVVVQLTASSPVLEPFLKSGNLKVVGARYDLHDGRVKEIQ